MKKVDRKEDEGPIPCRVEHLERDRIGHFDDKKRHKARGKPQGGRGDKSERM